MLDITIPAKEYYNEDTGEFVENDEFVLHLEHTLHAIAMWESKWKKPFLDQACGKEQKTVGEWLDYIKEMTMNEEPVPEEIYLSLTQDDYTKILNYMNDPMSAATFKDKTKSANQFVTADLVYYWMSALQIPFECEYWHFNRLMALIRVASANQEQPQKMSNSQILRQNAEINRARRAARRH